MRARRISVRDQVVIARPRLSELTGQAHYG
jgi:hypothetical protein